ncbi:MAG: helix-hairpin-helix domain-containing protein [Bacteroidota bacterium]
MKYLYPIFSPSQLRGLGYLSLFCLMTLCFKFGLRWLPPAPLPHWESLPISLPPAIEPKAPVSFPKYDLNTVSAKELEVYPGIGPVLSKRIVAFREAKKGFSDVKELKKVYGLSDSTYQHVKAHVYVAPHHRRQRPAIHRKPVNLNLATQAQLETRLKLSAKQAKNILKYRKILGFYSHPRQIKAVYGISLTTFQYIRPFLKVGDLSVYSRKDINRASARRLTYYACITESIAKRIIEKRKALGIFTRWEEVESIQGISHNCLLELKAHFFI